MSGPTATAIAAGGGDQPVGAGPFVAVEVGGHERDDRGQDQRRADALEDRPADQQHVRFGASAVVNEPQP